jgi:hypothetical protein
MTDRPDTGAPPRRFDVANGDADGLCAVLQWRLAHPVPASLVTGVKRDIELLRHVPVDAADEVLVCDLSMLRNRDALVALLDGGVRVRWFDHHAVPTPMPVHPHLDAHVDLGPAVCTSVLVDRALGGRFRAWAAVGAYGDNLAAVGDALAASIGLSPDRRAVLRRLGEAINYNAYGDAASDLVIAPAHLYARMAGRADPVAFAADDPIVDAIDRQRLEDLGRARAVPAHARTPRACVRLLPDEPWARRVIGCLANELANAEPDRAQAVLKRDRAGGWVASVRAPKAAPRGANELCARFGGAGRAAAAGVDGLPDADLARFVDAFTTAW